MNKILLFLACGMGIASASDVWLNDRLNSTKKDDKSRFYELHDVYAEGFPGEVEFKCIPQKEGESLEDAKYRLQMAFFAIDSLLSMPLVIDYSLSLLDRQNTLKKDMQLVDCCLGVRSCVGVDSAEFDLMLAEGKLSLLKKYRFASVHGEESEQIIQKINIIEEMIDRDLEYDFENEICREKCRLLERLKKIK